MAGEECLLMTLKRKEIDRVNDEFSDFSLSSPARKIRRLDGDLPPIIEEQDVEMPVAKPVIEELEPKPVIELAPEPVNEERAIVLFKPVISRQPSGGSIFVDSNLISGFKNQFLRPSYSSVFRQADNDEDENKPTNVCRAVVPWIDSQVHSAKLPQSTQNSSEIINSDEMGDEMMEEATMEIDDDNSRNISPKQVQFTHGFGVTGGNEGLPQWQQQHCVLPPPPQNNSTPIPWFW